MCLPERECVHMCMFAGVGGCGCNIAFGGALLDYMSPN